MVRLSAAKLVVITIAMLFAGSVTRAGAAVAGAARSTARPASAASSWGNAAEIPGLAALNKNGYAAITSVSCSSGGYCAAGGYYTDSHNHSQAFVASDRKGTWGPAAHVRGLLALAPGGGAEITSISCTSPGNCAAAGSYPDKRSLREAFVVSEHAGVWGTAKRVAGLAAPGIEDPVQLYWLSCASAGNCAAVGTSPDGTGHDRAFVVNERASVWGRATRVSGWAALNASTQAQVLSVSCASAGNCSAGGSFMSSRYAQSQAFVVSERRGVWGQAKPVPGLVALNTGDYAQVTSLSCGSAGNCAVVGSYSRGQRREAFVATERDGAWRKATAVPGLAALNNGGGSIADSVSCASAGNCAAGGWYKYGSRSSHWQAFIVVEVNGSWRKAKLVPGTATLNAGGRGEINSVSCASPGNCAAGGSYTDGAAHTQAFVVSEHDGVWGTATPVPGLSSLNTGDASITSLSCAPAGNCAAVGNFDYQADVFVVSRT
jgi:hypothetical protein